MLRDRVSGSDPVDPGRPGSLGDKNEGFLIVNKLAVKIDGYAVGEAVLGLGVIPMIEGLVRVGRQLYGEDIEAIVGSADRGEEYSTGGPHVSAANQESKMRKLVLEGDRV